MAGVRLCDMDAVRSAMAEITCFIPINKDAEIPDDCKLPNVRYIYLDHWHPYSAAQGYIGSELYALFNPVNGKYQVDAVITSKNVIAANIKRMFKMSEALNIPVFIAEYWVQTPISNDNSVETKLRAVSWSECRTFFPTAREKGFAITEARRYLSASSTQSIMDTGLIRSQGVPCELVQSIALDPEVSKFDKFTMLFAARFNSNKRWKEVLGAYEDIFRMGLDVEIKSVYPNSSATRRDLDKFEKVQYLEPLPYMDYLKLMNQCHVSVSMSEDEGFSFGLSEQFCTGNPLLLPNLSWAYALVGKDYPFFYSSQSELLALLKYCFENYDEARKMVAPIVADFVEEHDIGVAAAGYLAIMNEDIAGSWTPFREWDDKFTAVVAELPEQFTLKEFADLAAKKYDAGFGNYVILIGAHRNLHRWLVENADPVIGSANLYKKRS